jgi:NDP-sugar pyrophosphorylase family protein
MGIELSQQKSNFKENLSVVILCAGEGTRLKEITRFTPKPLIKINTLKKISILNHIINNLLILKINQIGIVIGYLGDSIREFISTLKKRNHSLQDKLLIIDTEDQYKLGSLYSFLSLTRNRSIFTPGKYYLLIPGDTIFDVNLLKEILSITSKNVELIKTHPVIFYRTIKLEEFDDPSKIVSHAEIENINSENILKRISQIKIKKLSSQVDFNQIIPVSLLHSDFIKNLLNLKEKIPNKTVWESFNYMISNRMKIYAYRIESKHQFYDIDNEKDLKRLKKIEDNRCSD